MNSRTYTRVLLWLLPLLLARAFIPSGFMLGTGPDGFGLVFCSGSMSPGSMSPGPMSRGAMPTGPHQHHDHVDHSQHAGHNHYEADAHVGDGAAAPSGDQDQHSHGDNDSTACPFAIGACAAVIDIPHLASMSTPPVDERISVDIIPTSGIATPRAHPIRGPPQSS